MWNISPANNVRSSTHTAGVPRQLFVVVGGGHVSVLDRVFFHLFFLSRSLSHMQHTATSVSLSLYLCVSVSLCLPLLLSPHSVQSSLFCGKAAHRPPLELKDLHRTQRLCEEEGWVALVLRCQHKMEGTLHVEYNNTYTQQRDTSKH